MFISIREKTLLNFTLILTQKMQIEVMYGQLDRCNNRFLLHLAE